MFYIEIKSATNVGNIASTLFQSKAVTVVNYSNIEHNLNNIFLGYTNNFIYLIENFSGYTTPSIKNNIPIF